MKITVNKNDILKIISAADPITSTKSNFSILANVLIETLPDGNVKIMASNMETTLQGVIPAKVGTKGSITINQNKLNNYLKNLPDGDILFSVDDNQKISIKSLNKKRKAQATIIGQNKNDFPDIPPFPENEIITTIEKTYFKYMIQKTIFAVATDTTQHVLNGVLLNIKNGYIEMVAIDGRRLAIIKKELNQPTEKEISVIIPQHVLHNLFKIINNSGPITFAFTNNRIYFKMNDLIISSAIIDGKFPKYDMFIPKSFNHSFSVLTSDMRNAISLAAVLVDAETNKMILNINDNVLNVSAHNNDYGKSNEDIEISYSDDPVKFGLNFKLINEILREIETEKTTYSFNDDKSQIKISCSGMDDYFYIVMPMKLDG